MEASWPDVLDGRHGAFVVAISVLASARLCRSLVTRESPSPGSTTATAATAAAAVAAAAAAATVVAAVASSAADGPSSAIL